MLQFSRELLGIRRSNSRSDNAFRVFIFWAQNGRDGVYTRYSTTRGFIQWTTFIVCLINEHILIYNLRLLIASCKLQADILSIIIIRLCQKSLPNILLAQKRMKCFQKTRNDIFKITMICCLSRGLFLSQSFGLHFHSIYLYIQWPPHSISSKLKKKFKIIPRLSPNEL